MKLKILMPKDEAAKAKAQEKRNRKNAKRKEDAKKTILGKTAKKKPVKDLFTTLLGRKIRK